MSDAAEALRAAMHAARLDYAGLLPADGKLHRFKAEGDHAQNSWFVLHGDAPAAGAFGCWKRDINQTWCEQGAQRSQADWDAVRCRWQEAEAARARAEAEQQAEAQQKADQIFSKAKLAQGDHEYLVAKGVQPYGELRQSGIALVLPLRDADGVLWSLQSIVPDGTKKFMYGGRVHGCMFMVNGRPDGPLVICEGYATGASIHEATGCEVVCALNCGNLRAVGQVLREKQQAREIIVAGDDDRFSKGNPGATKATDAALAIGAKLVLPKFADSTTEPTDFNDLHKLEGLAAVKEQVKAATVPEESDDDSIARLAALPLLDYERQREDAAKRLGCRAGMLDKLVDAKRPKVETKDGELQGRMMRLADVQPWQEPVNGAEVLNEVAATFARFVALPECAADALALWTAHAHSFKCFVCSPRLNISSPEKGCGKTTLRDVVGVLVPRPLPTENLSSAVLFRVIERHRPTVLADEYDSWLRDNEELRGLLNAGHREGGQALRCEGDGNEVRAFGVYAPAVLCGIGSLPGTLYDRSIVIRLERAKPGEVRQQFDPRHIERETELCRKLARFCADHKARFEACDPTLPPGAFNRLADNWRPLLAVAEVAGGDWPARAAAAFVKLTSREDADAQGVGTMLLADIVAAFAADGTEQISSKNLVDTLGAIEGRPWAEWGRAHKPISVHQLAKQLSRFGVAPRAIWVDGKTLRGYALPDFAEVFDRYLPKPMTSPAAAAPPDAGPPAQPHAPEPTAPAGAPGREMVEVSW